MTVKRFGALLLALLLPLTLTPALALEADGYEGDLESYYDDQLATMDTVLSGDWRYLKMEDGAVALVRYEGEQTDLTLPDTLDGFPVTAVDSFCFPDSTAQRITLSKGITALRADAFLYCTATEIILNEGLKSIGETAFFGCENLASLTIPTTVQTIAKGAFQGCSGLTFLLLPEGITALPDYLLLDCISLERLTVPASVTSIGEDVFPEQETFVLEAPAGSVAQAYAQSHGIAFATTAP